MCGHTIVDMVRAKQGAKAGSHVHLSSADDEERTFCYAGKQKRKKYLGANLGNTSK